LEIRDDSFNSPEGISQSLNDFKSKDWNGKKFSEVITHFRSTFKAIPFIPMIIKKGTILFRGRKNDEIKHPIFNELKEISIRENQDIIEFGRANIPGQSVFYCSTDEITVIREVTQWYVNDKGRAQDLLSKGILDLGWNPFTSFLTISAWVVNEDLRLALLFSPYDKRRSLEVQKSSEERFLIGPGENEIDNKSSNLILDFFSNEFARTDIKHHLEYLYSAYYAFEVFQEAPNNPPNKKYDGLQYVSVANDYKGENLALSKDAFEKKIQFLGANFCYTFNTFENKLDGDKDGIFARDKAALIKPDNTFEWIDYTGEYDYLIRSGEQFKPLILPPDGSKFSKAIVRING